MACINPSPKRKAKKPIDENNHLLGNIYNFFTIELLFQILLNKYIYFQVPITIWSQPVVNILFYNYNAL